jgi:hypothetical protein
LEEEMYFLEEGKAPFLEYLRNITPQVFLFTIAIFCYEWAQHEMAGGAWWWFFKSFGVVAGSLAIYAAWASALRYLEEHLKAVMALPEPRPKRLLSGAVLFVVNLVVLAAYVTAAVQAANLVAAAKA